MRDPVDYSRLTPHLSNPERRQELLKIERDLVEHPFPPQLVVENTSYCNLKCSHCAHVEMTRELKHMAQDLWEKIVTEVAQEMPQCEVWPTFYGEAFLLKDKLWQRLDFAHQVGCENLVLNSNGTLLDRWDNIEKILDSPLKRFILSLDGLSKETFEKIRKPAKWAKVYPAVEKLCRRRLERGQDYPSITAQFSIMKENVHEVEDYRRYWQERGAEVKVRPMLEWGAQGSIRSDTIIHGDDFRIACPWANNTMAIHQDGTVVACAVDYDGRFVVGNIREMTVKEAWGILGEKLRVLHREHRWQELPELCQGCGDWQVAGAHYEEETLAGTRPFWFDPQQENNP
ncbi:MAG: radical SAM protein [Magnetococcales bacterium]|nr:radical SAM protein [Magnetococcales bacterium]